MTTVDRNGNEVTLGRLYGGFAWPGIRPGFVVIVGEEEDPDPALGRHSYRYHLVDEAAHDRMIDLLRRCEKFWRQYNLEVFVYRYHEAGGHFLDTYNEGDIPFDVEPAAYTAESTGLIEYQISVIQALLAKSALHLPPTTQIIPQMLEIKAKEIHTADDRAFPAVAALGYAVISLVESAGSGQNLGGWL
jgi:hypothetical protein